SSGASSATLTVDTQEDADFDNETFTASIQSVEDTGQFEAIDTTNGADGQTPSQLTTIQDNDTAPTIRINDVTVNEDAGTATFTVSLSHATTEAVTFDFATSDDSATAGADYTANSDNGSIGAGDTDTTITVAITDDFLKEGDETYNVTLSNLSANVAATGNDLVGVGTITDTGSETDDPETVGSADTVYAVISGPATVTEGATTTDYTVSLIDAGGNAVTVNSDTDVTVVFANGSAEVGDYDATSQTVTISSGASSATLTVDTHEDADFDNDTFTASIQSVEDTGQFEAIDTTNGADGQTPSQLTTIQDNDTAPTIRIDDVTVNEDAGTATFTVSLSHATTEVVTFDFATSDDSATAGADYTANSGNGSIGAGDTDTTITVAITDDFLKEGDENYNVTLSNLSANVAATGNDLVGVGTITDAGSETDDPEDTTSADTVYAVISGPATVTEGATTTDYTVSLIDASGNAVTVNADTDVTVVFTNGSAEAGDYDATSQTVTISSGASSATLTVDTQEDADFDNETFTASIQSVEDTGQFEAIDTSTGADGQTPSQLTTIQDNDTAPTIRINDVTVNEDAGTATFTVSLSHATTEAVTFDFATSDDSATAGADYTANSGNGSIGAGDTDTTITVAITDDFLKEGDETYNVTLSNLSANVAATGNDLVGVGTITDEDSPGAEDTVTVKLIATDSSGTAIAQSQVTEGQTSYYKAILVDAAGNEIAGSTGTVDVNFGAVADSADATDYTATSGQVNLGQVFSAASVADNLVEPTEFFSVALVAATATITSESYEIVAVDTTAVTTNILNDDTFSADNASADDDDVNENTDGAGGNDIQYTGSISNVDSALILSIDDSTAQDAGGNPLTSNGDAVSYNWDAGTRTLTASTASTTVFTIVLSADNSGYTFTQVAPLDHADASGENDLTLPFNLAATDAGGNQATVQPSGDQATAQFSVTVNDDVPEVTGDHTIVTDNDGVYSESGFLDSAIISNDATTVTWNTAGLPNLVFDGKDILYVDHGDGTLTGELADGTVIFQAVIDPTTVNGDMNPQYSFQLMNVVGSLGMVSNEAAYTVISGGNIDQLELGFGNFLIDSMAAVDAGGVTQTVNTNNNWIGVGGNWINDGEQLFMDFRNLDGSDGQVTGIDFLVEGQGSADYTLNWEVTAAVDNDGNTVTYSGSVDGTGNGDMPFDIPLQNGAIYFTDITISAPNSGNNDFRVAFTSVTANNYQVDVDLPLSYTLTDYDQDQASGLIDITLEGNFVPEITVTETSVGNFADRPDVGDTNTVYESGLLSTTDNSEQTSSTFTVTSGDGLASLTVAGVELLNAGGSFAGATVINGTYGALTITGFDSASGQVSYSYALSEAKNHPGAGNDTLMESLSIVATDRDGEQDTENLQIAIVDDTPVNGDILHTDIVPEQQTNLMLIIDTSSSMADLIVSGGETIERMELLLRSIRELIESYQSLGETKVQIVTFSSGDSAAYRETWLDADAALAFIGDGTQGSRDSSLEPDGATDYDLAVATAETGFAVAGKLPAESSSNVSYFLSDGVPTEPRRSRGLKDNEVTEWQNFLTTNEIDSYAVGFGDDLGASSQFYLDPLAYDGREAEDRDGLLVTESDELTNELLLTIKAPVIGGLFGSIEADGFGADGGSFTGITLNGIVYSYSAALDQITYGAEVVSGSELQVHTDLGGVLRLNFVTGEYEYLPPADLAAGNTIQEQFSYTSADGDGDTSSGEVTLNVGRDVSSQLTGTANGERLVGGDTEDQLSGLAGSDILIGEGGGDTLLGGEDEDILFGGRGDDTLTGGSGADTFAWKAADADGGTDIITDFNAAEGDVLDLQDLLQSESADNLSDYLEVDSGDFDGDGDADDTRIKVDSDGSNNFSTPDQIIVLEDQTQLLQDLIDSNSLQTD
ncbi:type I secretion C-terminal target domain-containing protein, partial [Pseudomaricurvus alkylphenolicus]|uniref:Calx-beta domain-containing protein n=1 Tax=Pseudomaricurvus alkylphenolicus TaxID=1306991 RepID=UPI00141DD79E